MTIGREKSAGVPLGSSAGYDALATITSFAPLAIAARNGASRAVRNALPRPIVTGRSSVLAVALPRPGKCFAVAATPAVCSPRTNAPTSGATVDGSVPNERVPSKLAGEVTTSATGAKSMPTPAARSARAAAAASARACPGVAIAAAATSGEAHRRRRTVPPSWSTPTRSGLPRLHAAAWTRAIAAVVAVSVVQPSPRRMTPPTWPAATRARNAGVGGPHSGATIVWPAGEAAAGAAATAAAATLGASQRRRFGLDEAISRRGVEVVEAGRVDGELERPADARRRLRVEARGEDRARRRRGASAPRPPPAHR